MFLLLYSIIIIQRPRVVSVLKDPFEEFLELALLFLRLVSFSFTEVTKTKQKLGQNKTLGETISV